MKLQLFGLKVIFYWPFKGKFEPVSERQEVAIHSSVYFCHFRAFRALGTKGFFVVNSFRVFCSDSFPIFTSNETCPIKPPDVRFVVIGTPKLGHDLFCGARLTPPHEASSSQFAHDTRDLRPFATPTTARGLSLADFEKFFHF